MTRLIQTVTLPLLAISLAASAFGMDAERGAEVVREQNCLRCHNVRGQGAMEARDLSDRLMRNYTAPAMAATLWNHLPEMWATMSRELVSRPQPTEQDAEDLFAYLYSLRFFDRRGQSGRGERRFESKRCASCHSLDPEFGSLGTPLADWEVIKDPFDLVQEMWNHSSLMRRAAEQTDVEFERLSSRDLADITAFVQLRQGRTPTQEAADLSFPEAQSGKALFESNCGGCHPGIVDLQGRLRNETLTTIAAGIWNHLPRMQTVPLVAPGDMQRIVSWVWQMAYSQPSGSAMAGQAKFEEKNCASCHNDREGASAIVRGDRIFTPFTMISLWWKHGPLMEQSLQDDRSRWPFLSDEDVADIVAYMNSRP